MVGIAGPSGGNFCAPMDAGIAAPSKSGKNNQMRLPLP
jgi:hypothetical protein